MSRATIGKEDEQTDIRLATAADFSACETILRSLTDWFGIEASIQEYVQELRSLATLVAEKQGEVVGFLALKFHFEASAEIYVLGVRQELHRRGIGSALVEAAERIVRGQGRTFFHVKTSGPSHPSPEYARTRQFYSACGFTPIEELTDLWPTNPCLIMMKYLEVSEHTER